jgi:hypothetical protein
MSVMGGRMTGWARVLGISVVLSAWPLAASACSESGALAWSEPGQYRVSIPDQLAGCEVILRLRGAGGGAARMGRTRGGDGAFVEVSLPAPVGAGLSLTVGRGGGHDHDAGAGGKGADRAGSGGGLTQVELAGQPLAVAGAGGGGGANNGGDGGRGGVEAGEDGRPGTLSDDAGKGAGQNAPGAAGTASAESRPREERLVLSGRPGRAGDGAGQCCGGGGGGGAGWFGGGGGMGNPGGGTGMSEYNGGGGGGGSGLVDTSRATLRAARLGGGGRGGIDNRFGQDGSITIAWGPPGTVQAVDSAAAGGGEGAAVSLLAAADSRRTTMSLSQVAGGALPPLAEVTAVHLASVYEPDDGGKVTLRYGALEQPFVLVLTSYRAVRWDLGQPPATLRGVLVAAYEPGGRLLRLPDGIPVRSLSGVHYVEPAKDQKCRKMGEDTICTGSDRSRFSQADQAVVRASGRHVDTLASQYRASLMTVPGVEASR